MRENKLLSTFLDFERECRVSPRMKGITPEKGQEKNI